MAEVKDADARTVILESEFESVELSNLIESRRNPRQSWNEAAQADLIESIKMYGVLTPLIVRPVGNAGKYEILAGARRFRASREAKLKDVPCRIVKVENDTALEVIVVENLQRLNVHPLEEADSFREILELSGGDQDGLCNKVGKRLTYVTKRLALLTLIDKGKKLFLTGKMTEGHAILIARLQPVDQKEAVEYFENDEPSVAALRQWIEGELMLDLSKASFSKTDENLVKKAGSCAACPKRTGHAKELFDDIKSGDRCTDQACFKTKMQAHMAQLEASLKAAGHKVYGVYESYQTKSPQGTLKAGDWIEIKKKDFCEKAAKGIILDSLNAGRQLDICASPKDCKIHGSHGLHGSNGTEREKTRKEMRAQRMDAEVRLRLFKQIYEKKDTFDFVDKKLMAEHSFSRLWFAAKVRLCKAMDIEPKMSKYGRKDFEGPFIAMLGGTKDEEIVEKILVAITCAGDLDPKSNSNNLDDFAERLKINRKTVEKEVAESFAKKSKKMPKEKKASAKKLFGKKKAAKPKPKPVDPLEHSEGAEALPE